MLGSKNLTAEAHAVQVELLELSKDRDVGREGAAQFVAAPGKDLEV